jgi:hypothetical protein
MAAILHLTLDQLLATFAHNWPFLLGGAAVAAALKAWADQAAIARFLAGHGAASVLLATLLAVATPLCSCGTMAVILGMMASSVPWAPIVAFMAASPLTSPEETVISAGLFGWPFALTLLGASVAVGLGAGAAAHVLERRGWLVGQARLQPALAHRTGSGAIPAPLTPRAARPAPAAAFCFPASLPATIAPNHLVSATAAPAAVSCCALGALGVELASRPPQRVSDTFRNLNIAQFGHELLAGGARLLVMFAGFAFLGYFVNNLIPEAWVGALFGRSNRMGVPFAALVGLPLYLNSDASLPMIRAFVDHGAGAGAALAFIITGAGTSLGAISGALTIARWRVIALVVAALLIGAILAGYGFDLLSPGAVAR